MKKKIFFVFLIGIVGVIVVIAMIFKRNGIQIRDIPLILSHKLSHQQCDFNAMGGGIIAHAGGGIIQDNETFTYTNSKEALLQSINEGFRFIEIDLMLDSNGEIFGAHDYEHFYSITNEVKSLTPPSQSQILDSKIYRRFTPLHLKNINEIFIANPQIYLVTDKLNDFDTITNQLLFQDRILVEVFGLGKYYEALRKGIKYPMLSSGNIKVAMNLGIPMLAMHSSNLADSANLALAREYVSNGGCIAVFSSNDESFIKSHLGKSATMIYADYWDIKNAKCKLDDSKCKTY